MTHSSIAKSFAAQPLAALWTFVSAATFGLVSGVFWQYLGLIVVFAIGLIVILRTEVPGARGLDAFLPFSRVFYCAPVAAFGTEHFVFVKGISEMVPKYLPFHMFWAIFCGICLIVSALAIVVRTQDRLAATLLGIMLFLFDALLTLPAIPQESHNRIIWALGFRELQFSAGALAYAGSLYRSHSSSGPHWLTTYARYVIGAGMLFFGVMQILHPSNVPGVPLEKITPDNILFHGLWGYLCGAVYVIAGICLLLNRRAREAASAAGIVALSMLVFVYAPILFLQRGDIESFNYFADTMMYAGSVLMLASALPKEHAVAQSKAAMKEGHAHA
ncbi:MAG: hypothetical protein WA823_02515 [Candidatus Acidiferrales bacterium]